MILLLCYNAILFASLFDGWFALLVLFVDVCGTDFVLLVCLFVLCWVVGFCRLVGRLKLDCFYC